MFDNDKRSSSSSRRSSRSPSPSGDNRPTVSSRFEQFEKRQSELWRLTFFLLFVLALVFAVTSWDTVRSLAHHFEALPIGLVVLVALFGFYAWKRTQEISELRGMVRGIEQHDSAPPSDKQLDQFFEMIVRSQQGYRDLIDSFDDVLLAVSLDGQIRAVNRSFSDLVATPFQQIVGKPVTDFVQEGSGEGSQLIKRAMPRFLERRHWTGVIQVRLKNQSSIYYFDCVAHAMMREDQIHGVTVLARDVSALRKNEARFTELFETLQEGIYITNPEGDILDANPALVRMLGYASKEELLAKRVHEILVDREERKSIKAEVERQPMLQGREITLISKDGSSIVCLNSTAAVRDNSGKVLRYQGSLMDITGRREMERRLHQQQEFARRLVDSFPDLIFVLDTAARYTFISPRIMDVLGLEPEETRELELGGRTHPEDRAALHSLYQEILAGRQSFASLEVRDRNKRGEWRRIRYNFSPLFDEAGKIDGVVLSGRDVTDLKRLEEQLIQAEKLAAMGQMLAGVAHELNNPLTAILGITELLRERAETDESAKRQLDLTHRQARRAAAIVQNLLEFSRPASPQKKLLDLNGLLERTLQLHEHSLRRNNIEVEFHPQPGFPEVIGDANQLIQVFLNMVTNAEQAIREVRDAGHIQIRLGRHASRLFVTVQDDGVGIRPDALPRIFDPFYTTKRPGGGTGLGLSICMSIVREHGGTMEGEALPGGGSVFTVNLPIASTQESPAREMTADYNRSDLRADFLPRVPDLFRHRAVLVLDDEEGIRMLLEDGLSARGLQVDCAATEEQALTLLHRRSYDALLCDLHLSSNGTALSGRDAAERLLASAGPRKPALIYMTGDLIQTGTEAPLLEEPRCLRKPFRIVDVLAVLREIFSSSTAEKVQH